MAPPGSASGTKPGTVRALRRGPDALQASTLFHNDHARGEWKALKLAPLPAAHGPCPAAASLHVAKLDNAKAGRLHGLLRLMVVGCV